MRIREIELVFPFRLGDGKALAALEEAVLSHLPGGCTPLRFAMVGSNKELVRATVSVLESTPDGAGCGEQSIFKFCRRGLEDVERFNVALVVPTGIGAAIGGHAGDATPVARLIAETCDLLVVHPNVVNASDINEMPGNALYVEGSVLARLIMGTVGLLPVRSNRVLVIVDSHEDRLFVNAAVNAVSAARASYGLVCREVIELDPPVKMKATFTGTGTAAGEINGLEQVYELLDENRGKYDAVAISSMIAVPREFHQKYFDSGGDMVNPWGGVEAMLTHAISGRFNIPSAHSPMFEDRDVANKDPGVVEPRMAAEAISLTFLQCVLKGLYKSPRLITDSSQLSSPGVISASNISCLVIPDRCIGLPTLAALEQGIPVVAVQENVNLMENDLTALPWEPGQLHVVRNYWEAAGVLCAIRAGMDPKAVRRPLAATKVVARTFVGSDGGGSAAEGGNDARKTRAMIC